jgi:hypothetical protein
MISCNIVIESLIETIKALKTRICFIGMSQEKMREGRPDWSNEVNLIEAALKLYEQSQHIIMIKSGDSKYFTIGDVIFVKYFLNLIVEITVDSIFCYEGEVSISGICTKTFERITVPANLCYVDKKLVQTICEKLN